MHGNPEVPRLIPYDFCPIPNFKKNKLGWRNSREIPRYVIPEVQANFEELDKSKHKAGFGLMSS